jgi:glutamine amidotransferase
VTSVLRALRHLGAEAEITADVARVAAADKVIFPGVGAAASCMAKLRERGLDEALRAVVDAGTPVLGICVGMQLLFEHSEEDGGVDCLGLLPGVVRRFRLDDPAHKVPHMGWNPLVFADGEPLAAGLGDDTACYFVHSYYCAPADDDLIIARSEHGPAFCAGVRRDNLVALQCHPEKSGTVGLTILKNFIEG